MIISSDCPPTSYHSSMMPIPLCNVRLWGVSNNVDCSMNGSIQMTSLRDCSLELMEAVTLTTIVDSHGTSCIDIWWSWRSIVLLEVVGIESLCVRNDRYFMLLKLKSLKPNQGCHHDKQNLNLLQIGPRILCSDKFSWIIYWQTMIVKLSLHV